MALSTINKFQLNQEEQRTTVISGRSRSTPTLRLEPFPSFPSPVIIIIPQRATDRARRDYLFLFSYHDDGAVHRGRRKRELHFVFSQPSIFHQERERRHPLTSRIRHPSSPSIYIYIRVAHQASSSSNTRGK